MNGNHRNGPAVARRTVLLAGGATLVLTGLRSSAAKLSAFFDVTAEPAARLHLVRPQDMLVLDFDFHNLEPVLDADPPQLRRIDPFAKSVIVAHFGPQHIMEQAIYQNGQVPAPGEFAARAAGGSRIAFVVPETVKSLPFSEAGLLDWWRWIMQVATTPADSPLTLPTDLVVVDWLHLSPEPGATWSHSAAPVVHGDRTELWHTRLALRGPDGRPVESVPLAEPAEDAVPAVRALYADTPSEADKAVFRTLLANGDATVPSQLVRLTSDPAVEVRKPVRADLLSLSASGATLDLEGKWAEAAHLGLTVKRWDHHAWQGRDNKVVIETYVFLVPFGHRAVLVTETERVFDDRTGAAYLRQQEYIQLSERTRTFPAAGHPHAGRAFPLREVTITNAELPVLPAPENREPVAPGFAGANWIQDINAVKPGGGYSDVVFTCVATDLAGRRVEFTVPMAYLTADHAVHPADAVLKAVVAKLGGYDALTGPDPDRRRVLDLHGQQIAYLAEETTDTTSFPTTRWFWGLERPDEGEPDPLVPRFYPRLLCAEAQVPAIDATLGPGPAVYLVHHEVYLAQGLTDLRAAQQGNRAQVYMRVQDSVDSIAKLGDPAHDKPVTRKVENTVKAAALTKPDLSVGALSLRFGVMSGKQANIDKLVEDDKVRFDEYFDESLSGKEAVLFGGILLGLIAQDFDLDATTKPQGLLRLTHETVYPKDKEGKPDKTQWPTGQVSKATWETKLRSLLAFRATEGKTKLVLESVHRIDYLERKTTAYVQGTINDFTLIMPPTVKLSVVAVNFTKITFKRDEGGDNHFDPDVQSVRFLGPLEFIHVLEDFIGNLFTGKKTGGGGGGTPGTPPSESPIKAKPQLRLEEDGLTLGGQLSVPGIQAGFFSIMGIALWGAVVVPFNGDPVIFRIAFSSAANPFKVTVYGIGGGGHFAVELDSREGVRAIEGSIEVVGNFAADLVVAAGRLTLELGIFYRNQKEPTKQVILRGFVRATGRLSVLGLINLTIEFYAAIQYIENPEGKPPDTKQLLFTARVVASIDLLFISEQVTIEFQKILYETEHAARIGQAAAPSVAFGDLVSRDDWNLYCDSFGNQEH